MDILPVLRESADDVQWFDLPNFKSPIGAEVFVHDLKSEDNLLTRWAGLAPTTQGGTNGAGPDIAALAEEAFESASTAVIMRALASVAHEARFDVAADFCGQIASEGDELKGRRQDPTFTLFDEYEYVVVHKLFVVCQSRSSACLLPCDAGLAACWVRAISRFQKRSRARMTSMLAVCPRVRATANSLFAGRSLTVAVLIDHAERPNHAARATLFQPAAKRPSLPRAADAPAPSPSPPAHRR